ncbi:hypothetical protein NDU88_001812 [Pleurodeles waltl]|uniref:Uncharacterized protein n=1 Tax=Pleurodeles waltl TaxID=8319 RepID=A0AAV7SAX6_PLEWA|nr:hypothetical protein NDU88_001812 [Pleurodeles waltl]
MTEQRARFQAKKLQWSRRRAPQPEAWAADLGTARERAVMGPLGPLLAAATSGGARLWLGRPLRVGDRGRAQSAAALGGVPALEAEILDVRGVRQTVSGSACDVEWRKAVEPRVADECTWALDCGCRAGTRG